MHHALVMTGRPSVSGRLILLLNRMSQISLVVAISFVLTGCGDSGPRMVPVTGVVSFKSKPTGKINVMFVPVDQKGLIAEGTSDDSGKFVLQSLKPGDGAMTGNYKVAFKYVSDIIPDMPGFVGGVKPEPSPIPLKFADAEKSGITASVDGSASKNEFKFDLE
jgi:hypothetical protein